MSSIIIDLATWIEDALSSIIVLGFVTVEVKSNLVCDADPLKFVSFFGRNIAHSCINKSDDPYKYCVCQISWLTHNASTGWKYNHLMGLSPLVLDNSLRCSASSKHD